VREKPIVTPVLIGTQTKPIARKIRTSAPSMPAGSIVWVDVDGRALPVRSREKPG